MRSVFSGFALGAMLLAWPWPWRPWLLFCACAALACVFATAAAIPGFRHRAGSLTPWWIGLLFGVGWSAAHHEQALADRLANDQSPHAVPLVVRIVSEPLPLTGVADGALALRFLAEVQSGGAQNSLAGRRIRLSWYDAQPLRRGELWRMAATLRAPWRQANPGGFDLERWLLGRGIDGTGSVRRGARLEAADPSWLDDRREKLGAFVTGLELQHAPVLVALLVGVSGTIPAAQWDVFRVTGTIHLMVISGLHIGLAAGFGHAIGRALARAVPWLLLRVDARTIGAWSGVGCGLAYLALSGGGLPALRACLMAGPALFLAAWGRRSQAASALLVALGVVLALEPLALHQQGFWLSFGAVGLLILRYGGRYDRQTAWASVAGAQVLLTVCMAPLLVVLTGAVPMVAIVANLVAVPLVSFAVVPLTLVGGLLALPWPAAAAASFWFADQLFDPLYRFLSWCAQIPQLHAEPQPMLALVAGAGVLAWLFGVPRRQWLLVGLSVACALLSREVTIPAGEFRVIGLDVGQGDAILIDTASHRLLFDAGPAFPGGFDAGAAAVVPSLLATGPARLDALVLSHEDLDHVGGAVAVERVVSPAVVYASFPRPGALPCAAREWRWDGVVFRFVTVPRSGTGGRARGSNDGSCILLIDNGRRRVLLAGDIGAGVEGKLVRALAGGVDLLFAPHHGSGSSSSAAFVRVLRPARVFVSAGRDNRYGHPHPRVLARYRAIGAEILLTAERGALIWESALPDQPRGWRDARVPYWRVSGPNRTAR